MSENESRKVLLSLRNVSVKFNVRGRILTAIRNVSLDIYENESIAIVGESGSGKSVFTKTFAGMLDTNGFISQGNILFDDAELADTVVALTPAEIQTYNNYFHTIREKIEHTEHPYRTELVKALLLSMFYDMSGVIYRVEQQGLKVQSRADVFFSRFIKLLEENFHRERRVSWYADKLNITPKYLSEVVKAVSKRTPTEWIDNYVILELRVLLRNSTKTIKEITDEMCFPNQSFLGKYFKEHVGMSPSEFRKRL